TGDAGRALRAGGLAVSTPQTGTMRWSARCDASRVEWRAASPPSTGLCVDEILARHNFHLAYVRTILVPGDMACRHKNRRGLDATEARCCRTLTLFAILQMPPARRLSKDTRALRGAIQRQPRSGAQRSEWSCQRHSSKSQSRVRECSRH